MSVSPSPASRYESMLTENFSRHPTGKPLFIETFPALAVNNYAVEQSGGGTGTLTLYNATNTVQNVFNKASFALLSSGVAGGFINMFKPMGLTKSRRFGLEVFFGFPHQLFDLRSRCNLFGLTIQLLQNYTIYQPTIYYKPSSDKLFSPDLDPIMTLGLPLDVDSYNTRVSWQDAKLIVDFDTKKYVTLFWNEHEIDLSNVSIPAQATGLYGNRLFAQISVLDINPATQFTTYIGGFIFTSDE